MSAAKRRLFSQLFIDSLASAIIFDFDGVIADSDVLADAVLATSWPRLLKRATVPPHPYSGSPGWPPATITFSFRPGGSWASAQTSPTASITGRQRQTQKPDPRRQLTIPPRYSHPDTCFSWISLKASLYQVRGGRTIRPPGRKPSRGALTFVSTYQANVYGIFCITDSGNYLYYPRAGGAGAGASREQPWHEKMASWPTRTSFKPQGSRADFHAD